jgi:hypothetical protein
MTFDPFDTKPNSSLTAANEREHDLIRAVFSTPQGRELLGQWKTRLCTSNPWTPGMPDDLCRDLAGRRAVYVDIINICQKEKPNEPSKSSK